MSGSGCRKCCSLPHGMPSVLAATLGTLGFALGSSAVWSCRFVISSMFSAPRGVGLYSFEGDATDDPYYSYYCVTFNASTAGYDAAWTAARALGGIANAIGFVCMIMIWVSACFAYKPSAWKVLGMFEAFAGVCILCTYSFFASSACNNGCTFSTGAGLVVGSFLLYAIAACVCFKMPPYEAEMREVTEPAVLDAAPGTVTTTETVQPDGTKVIEKVTVNADGSKTVERTTETPVDKA